MTRGESGTRDGREPGADRFGPEGDVEVCGLDVHDVPAVCERALDLLLRDPPWSPSGRLLVAETEHVVPATGPNHVTEAVDERRPVLIVEHVEQPAVEDCVELLAERV